jgi:hypothetical protein
MALLFQSNPDQWDLRQNFRPGGKVYWFVTRYLKFMKPGVLTLLWEAQGSEPLAVKGLYGWGITLAEPVPDKNGRLRIPLQYVERWVSASDSQANAPESRHIAGIPAQQVLSLSSWQDHPLAKMPVGTNFVVTPDQVKELCEVIVQKKYPSSAFPQAAQLDQAGKPVDVQNFAKQYINEVYDG